ncbi:MAG: sugar nucleotide-binding protein, partial [Acidobacteria bacterium]|nr:sugar nucleotide-binding protein [Acidobacteriota bacterium]
PQQVERAIRINSLLPHTLAAAAPCGSRILQIATDCVYSGARGAYQETDPHDALDVYGKTKSLGECHSANTHHLRCSVIGPEPKDFKFLFEWFLRQPPAARVDGFTNHRWNGIPHLLHIVPSGDIPKAALLREFARYWDRPDVVIRDKEAATVIDRTLATSQPERNRQLWQAAGYAVPPTVPEMLAGLAAFGGAGQG